jgi:tetratricopeptide (TPR) repeat protein
MLLMTCPISKKHSVIIIILAISILLLAVYWPVQNYGFLNYDDQLYVTENIKTQSGLNTSNIVNILKDIHSEGNWHPVTMLSHALDWGLFRDKAGGHHWTSVIIHILNAVLLFFFFQLTTGAIWRSALIAALFALHPINVESVAWIAQRKNVLSTFFWILTMLIYVWYVKQPNWKRYFPVLISFSLGLMSKPMLVTLPFTLLLLDYWPLQRFSIKVQPEYRQSDAKGRSQKKTRPFVLVLEKVPLIMLAAIASYLTLYAQKAVNAVVDIQSFPLLYRLGNALISYALYIKKMLWPFDLAVFYPFNYNMALWHIILAALPIMLLTVLVLFYVRKFPYLLTGWFWYLGTLVPVIGFVQVGSQSMADRYAYVPLIGLFLMLTWGMGDMLRKRISEKYTVIIAVLIVLGLTMTTYHQIKYWKDTLTLFSHAVDVTKNNAYAHSNVAGELLVQGDVDEAMVHLEKALSLTPDDYNTLVRAARAYHVHGNNEKAIEALRRAIQGHPDYARTYHDLYRILSGMGRKEEALQVYIRAVELNKNNPDIYFGYGSVLAERGDHEEAIVQYEKALKLRPRDAGAYFNIGVVLAAKGDYDAAMNRFKDAIRINPDYAPAHYRLALILKQKGFLEEATKHYREAVRINPAYGRE